MAVGSNPRPFLLCNLYLTEPILPLKRIKLKITVNLSTFCIKLEFLILFPKFPASCLHK
jgi:hypothetical protein